MTDGTARAWGWVRHLREGGTIPWTGWAGTAEPAEPGERTVPGAQQLELLRRLNDAGRPSSALVHRVLAVDPPRRSRPSLPLAGGPPVPHHGPRPVDPGELEELELLRVAGVLLAGDLATRTPPAPRRPWTRPWRVRYRLLGDPEHVAVLRRHLAARGRPEGGVGQVLVLGTDTGRMLVDVWTAHCFRHGSVPWVDWLERRVSRGSLPAPIDLHRLARTAAGLPTSQGVRVVTDPARAARRLGVRRGPDLPHQPAASAVDLARRVSGALRPLALPEQRARLVTGVLRPALADAPGLPLVVPRAHRAWLEEEAARLHDRLTGARYPVLGDPSLVLPGERAGVEEPEVAETLALALRMLLSEELREPVKEEP